MFDVIDIGTFILLEAKYGKELECYDEERNEMFLNTCIESNKRCLELMGEYQELLFRSIKAEGKTEELYEELRRCKADFDECLERMNRLSKSLNIAATPRPEDFVEDKSGFAEKGMEDKIKAFREAKVDKQIVFKSKSEVEKMIEMAKQVHGAEINIQNPKLLS